MTMAQPLRRWWEEKKPMTVEEALEKSEMLGMYPPTEMPKVGRNEIIKTLAAEVRRLREGWISVDERLPEPGTDLLGMNIETGEID